EIAQLLWAAQGITDPRGFRTAPSAGALYPLELYLALPEGWYHYRPEGHLLELLGEEDLRPLLWEAGLRQGALREAPAIFVVVAVPARTEAKYGARALRYVQLEAGHAAQNLLLQATALGLGAVPIGAFDDAAVRRALRLPPDTLPLYLIPVGEPSQR
ncbi:MAG: SagB/ThcOx family dehydrogenase, partial [Chloroflexia bacterium]